MKRRWNGFAIAGFILSFFDGFLGLIFSIIGVCNASVYNDKGKVLGIFGIIISCFTMIIEMILVACIIMAVSVAVGALSAIPAMVPDNIKDISRETVLEVYAKNKYEDKVYKKEGTKKIKKNVTKGYTFTVEEMDKETPGIRELYRSCDVKKSKVTIYPTKPYGITDYTIKTSLSCK